MFYIYALISQLNSHLYIGQTNNIERRMKQHNSGKVLSTKAFIPYKMIYLEEFKERNSAVLREKKLKTAWGRKFLKKYI